MTQTCCLKRKTCIFVRLMNKVNAVYMLLKCAGFSSGGGVFGLQWRERALCMWRVGHPLLQPHPFYFLRHPSPWRQSKNESGCEVSPRNTSNNHRNHSIFMIRTNRLLKVWKEEKKACCLMILCQACRWRCDFIYIWTQTSLSSVSVAFTDLCLYCSYSGTSKINTYNVEMIFFGIVECLLVDKHKKALSKSF